uniref:Protein N-terminal glutamine amidohydrolase n=1 Tax=Heligmosomoides polygyrus TaxID=6339 RepID=A0A183GEX4_HELPZ
LFAQRAAGERPFVVWDYHVVMLEEAEESSNLIWDLDTLLPFPCTFDDYWKAAEYSRSNKGFWKVIPCEKYLEHFSSDRSHMKTEDGAWLSPAPSWEPILKDGLNNLDDFISMDSKILTDIIEFTVFSL